MNLGRTGPSVGRGSRIEYLRGWRVRRIEAGLCRECSKPLFRGARCVEHYAKALRVSNECHMRRRRCVIAAEVPIFEDFEAGAPYVGRLVKAPRHDVVPLAIEQHLRRGYIPVDLEEMANFPSPNDVSAEWQS